jgi:hypothetical protein
MEKILFISPSTYDKKTWAFATIVFILPILLFAWFFFKNLSNDKNLSIILGFMLILFVLMFVIGILYTPYKYILTNSDFIIKRHIKDILIPLKDIKIMRLMPDEDKKKLMRTFGYGGFGYFGRFESKKYNGRNGLYVTARRFNNWTLVTTQTKKYVIAPDDVALIDAVNAQINIPANVETELVNDKRRSWFRWIPVAIVLAVFAVCYLSYKEPKATVEQGLFKLSGIYGVTIPLNDIARADTIVWREMPAISIRTNGISLMKVNRGHFRTTDGENIRLSTISGVHPIVRITDKAGNTVYFNRNNPAETRQIFDKLKTN